MKKSISLILVLAICFLYTACSVPCINTDYIPAVSTVQSDDADYYDDGSILFGNDRLEYNYSDDDYNNLISSIDALEQMLENGSAPEKLLRDYNYLENELLERLINQASVASILSCVYSSVEKYQLQSININEMQNNVYKRLYTLYKRIYNEPEYKDVFFADWQESDIEYALKMSDCYTDEYIRLKKENDLLQSEYFKIIGTKGFLEDSADIYIKIVENNKQTAKLMGYDNYMDYAYDCLYGREYSPQDTDSFSEYVKKYVVPSAGIVYNSLKKASASSGIMDIQAAESIIKDDLNSLVLNKNRYSNSISEYVERYFKTISNEMYFCYLKMIQDGNYVITDNPEISDAGAFTTNVGQFSVCYFGPGYHDIYTFIHEFGHYHAITYSNTMQYSLDLHEVQSQSNEWLFTSFLKGEISENQFRYISLSSLLNDLCVILNALSVNEFEKYVYSHDDIQANELDGIMKNIMLDMGAYEILSTLYKGDPTSYWHYVTIDNPGYYISYAVSLIPSLNIYYESLLNYKSAVEIYLKLSCCPENADFKSSIIEAGLDDPFSENAFEKIMLLCRL